LREDLDKLQTEHTDLRARIAALEARAGTKEPEKKLGTAKARGKHGPTKSRRRAAR
jgi:cell division septum initiation protein DivIVA